MFKHYNKDQKLVLLGACLYYMGLGGFIFNSQSTVLASVRELYNFPMTKISLYTTMGYVAQIIGAALLGTMIFRLSQKMKKYYFICVYLMATLGLMCLALFADTPLFYVSRFMIGFGVSTVSIIIPYILNQWIDINPGSAIGLSSACAGLGGVISNPLASFLFEKFSTTNGIIILTGIAVAIMVPSVLLIFRKPVPETQQKAKTTTGDSSQFKSSTILFVLLIIVVAGSKLPSLFTSYINMFSIGNGFTPAFAASLSSIIMMGNIISKFVYGILIDKMGAPKASILLQCCIITGAVMFLLVPTSTVGMCVGTLAYGMQAALSNMGINRLTMATFGYEGTRKYQGMLLSMANAVVALSSPLVGVMYDKTNTFNSFFYLIIGTMAICIVATSLLAKFSTNKQNVN